MEANKYGSVSGSRSEAESVVSSRSNRSGARSRGTSVRSNGSESRYQRQQYNNQQQQQQQQRDEEPLDLHELAKGWKAAINRATDPSTRHEAWIKNDRGNLPLHSAASFRAPREVTEALLEAYPEAASLTNNYGNLALHFAAWKKGPLDVERLLLEIFPEGAAQKNNHGNLPLHYAAHYNAPLEVVQALYDAYPDAALQKNNDSNTPLDLAIADGASPDVVALLQGKSVPPGEEELMNEAKRRVERLEQELQKYSGKNENVNGDLESVLSLLMEVKNNHQHALYSAGINAENVKDTNSLLDEIRRASAEALPDMEFYGAVQNKFQPADEEDMESQLIEDALIPPDDEVEKVLSKIIGLDPVKNHIRGLRRTIEIEKQGDKRRFMPTGDKSVRHLALVGNPGTGKTFVARHLMPILYKIGAVAQDFFLEVGRDDLIDGKSAKRTVEKTRRIIQRARGGVIFVDEAYTMLPSKGRRKVKDHGVAALQELAKVLPEGDPLIIFAGYPDDLQLLMASDIGFKGNFLLQIEFPDPSPMELARIFLSKVHSRGFIPGTGLTAQYLAELIKNNTDADHRMDRNGRLSENLMQAVLTEIKRKRLGDHESSSKISHPVPGSKAVSQYDAEDITITVEDVHNAIMNGL